MKPDPRLLLALLVAGCQAAPLPDTSVAEVQLLGRDFFHAVPRVASAVPPDGLARTQVNLSVEDANPAPHFSLQALPSSFWTQAKISLFSPTANVTYDPAIHSQTINAFTTTSAPASSVVGPSVLAGPGVVAVDPAGNPYASNGAAIVKYTGGTAAAFGPAVNSVAGMAFDAAGNLYVAESPAKKITKITPAGTGTTFYGGALATDPRGLAFDRQGNLFVTNLDGTVVRVAPDGTATAFASGLEQPIHVAIDGSGNLYAVSGLGNKIGRVTAAGVTNPAWYALVGMGPGGIVYSNGALIVGSATSPDLVAIDPATALARPFLASAVTDPLAPSGDYAFDLAVSAAGTLFAPERGRNQVWKIAPDTHYRGTAAFPALRPAPDYSAQVFLLDPNGGNTTLAGSQNLPTVALNAGNNVLDFQVKVNAGELSYQLAASANNNVVAGNAIVQGDLVTLATGIDNNQPGVDHLVLELSGAAYPGATCTVAVLPAAMAGSWSTFAWNTGAASVLPGGFTGADGYQPAKLAAPTSGLVPVAGTLAVKAYDVRNNLVGTANLTLAVYGKPAVAVNLF